MKKNNPLVILCYHGMTCRPSDHLHDPCFITPEKFATDLHSIHQSGWVFTDLAGGIEQLKRHALNGPSVAITFDDGFSSTLQLSKQILKNYSAHATVFLPTQLLRESRTLWFTDVIQMIAVTKRPMLEFYGRMFDLSDLKKKSFANQIIQKVLKELHPKAIERILIDLRSALDVDANEAMEEHLTASEVECRQALESGFFDFGAHSATHSIHTKLTLGELRREISQSVGLIREMFRKEQPLYAYPNGRKGDFSAICANLLAQQGVSSALTTIPGWNRQRMDPYAIRRFCIGPQTDVRQILLSPFWKSMSFLS